MRARWLPIVALLGFAVAVVPALASNQSVEVGPGVSYSPSEVAVKPGESVTFTHTSGLHNVVFEGSATPFNGGTSNTSGPASSDPWTATATFPVAGKFTYHCGVHGVTMSGVVHVDDSGTVPTPSVPTGPTTDTTPTTTGPTTPTSPTTPTTPGVDKSPPSMANLAPASRSFCLRAGRRCRVAGVTFELTLSEPAELAGTLRRRGPGRRARFKQFGTLRFNARIAGDNRFRFVKTAEGRRLQRGSYRLTLRATDSSENRSKSRTVSFVVR